MVDAMSGVGKDGKDVLDVSLARGRANWERRKKLGIQHEESNNSDNRNIIPSASGLEPDPIRDLGLPFIPAEIA